MATTNFQQWDPGQTNQLSDSAYTSDSSRSGGAGTGAVFPSAAANKLFYQLSTFIAAFGAMMAAKGYTNSDSSLSALQGVLANLITSADVNSKLTVVAYSPSPTFNAAHTDGFEMTLSGNVSSATLQNFASGAQVAFIFVQDSVGGRTVTPLFSGMGTPDPTPGAVSIQKAMVRSDGSLHPLTAMTVS